MSASAPLLRAHDAKQLATVAAALAGQLHGGRLADAATTLSDSAGAYSDSPNDSDAATRLTAAATAFIAAAVVDSSAQASGEVGVVIDAAARFLRTSDDLVSRFAPLLRGTPSLRPLNADALADAAALQAWDVRDTALAATAQAFAVRAWKLSRTPGDSGAAAKLCNAGRTLVAAAAATPEAADVSDLLRAAHIVLTLQHPPAPGCRERILRLFGRGKILDSREVSPVVEELALMKEKACRFAQSAQGSSMKDAADAFARAVERFASGKGHQKRAVDTELCKMGRLLRDAVRCAPASEEALAAVAIELTWESLSLVVLLSQGSQQKPTSALSGFFSGLLRCGCWFRAAMSTPEPILPIHRKHKSKLTGKHQALFGVALAALLSLLISAAAAKLFPSAYAPWIGGSSVLVCIVVSAGMVANHYGKTNLALRTARHLSRLGMMGLAVLLGIFGYWAFFPFSKFLLWAFVLVPVALHGWLWITSWGDDNSSVTIGETDGSCHCCRCKCSVANLDV